MILIIIVNSYYTNLAVIYDILSDPEKNIEPLIQLHFIIKPFTKSAFIARPTTDQA
jgi:hypothetical protein